jgi:uncharacterized membrane protein YccC
MTMAVMVPVLLFGYYEQLIMGVTIAVGSLCVGITDNPGPIHHRRNGMLITLLLLFATIILTGLSAPVPWLAMVLIVLLAFFYSIIGIYGNRATAAGMACMLVMVLNIDKSLAHSQVLLNAMLTLLGGAWYFVLSLGLHHLRPYKLVQQVVGDCMQETAKYMRIKASFYDINVDYDKSYHALTETQVQVHQKQDMARELLFKTRSIVRESTHTGRVLVMAFIDTLDLFERIMTSQQEYRILHEQIGDTPLLKAFQNAILQLADDLDRLGIAFQEGSSLKPDPALERAISKLETIFKEDRAALLNDENAGAFISLRHILNSLKDLRHRINTLHAYSSYDLQFQGSGKSEKELRRFVSRSDFNPKIVLENLNTGSNIFRHSIRVSAALLLGYIVGLLLPVGHDYWVLLTIIVILKPAYSLTRKRNIERLSGTVIGAAIAAIMLNFIHQSEMLVAVVFVCMITTYSLIRTKYFIAVVFMTVYIVIAFHLLKSGNINTVLQDRVVDTTIGSVLAFILLFVIPPKWEHETINQLCADLLETGKKYFTYISGTFVGKPFENQPYKLKRKATYVALANLGDAFQRMLNEPKSKQQKGEQLHQLIVSGHVLVSHIATLSSYRQQYASTYRLKSFEPVIEIICRQLDDASNILVTGKLPGPSEPMETGTYLELCWMEADSAIAGQHLRHSFLKRSLTSLKLS